MSERNEGDLLIFGNAAAESHKMLLFIGREPNNALGKCHEIHRYGNSWTSSGSGESSPFWDKAHGLCASAVGRSARGLKAACAMANTGPIAFADLSPLSLDKRFSVVQKRRAREDVKVEDIRAHVERTFSHPMIKQRVSLVIASGLTRCGLDHGVPLLDEICREFNLPIRHIHSLSSMAAEHTHPARLAQLGEDVEKVRSAVSSFIEPGARAA